MNKKLLVAITIALVISIILILSCTSKKSTGGESTPPTPTVTPLDPNWFSEGPIYETHPYYYDGTFKGLIKKIPEIADLGIKTIYLLPIWEHANGSQPQNFIYLINDYNKIDPVYGTEAELKQLVDTVHANGMQIVFELVTCCADTGSIPYTNNWIFRISLQELINKANSLSWTLQYGAINGRNIVTIQFPIQLSPQQTSRMT
jgi:hypothetical protein